MNKPSAPSLQSVVVHPLNQRAQAWTLGSMAQVYSFCSCHGQSLGCSMVHGCRVCSRTLSIVEWLHEDDYGGLKKNEQTRIEALCFINPDPSNPTTIIYTALSFA